MQTPEQLSPTKPLEKVDKQKRTKANQPRIDTPYLTEEEAGAFIRKSTYWMQRARRRGDGPSFHKLGHNVVYDIETLHAFVRAGFAENTGAYETHGGKKKSNSGGAPGVGPGQKR